MAGSADKKTKPVMYVVLGVLAVAAATVWWVFSREPGPEIIDAGEPASAAEQPAAPAATPGTDAPAPANARTPPR